MRAYNYYNWEKWMGEEEEEGVHGGADKRILG